MFSLLASCSSSSLVNKQFTSEQIEDLKTLVTFFNVQMCPENPDFETCFNSHLPELLENGWMPILENIDFDAQQEMYASLNSGVFDEIWTFCPSRNRDKIVIETLCPTNSGQYIKFLEALSKRNESLKYYYDDMLLTGDIEPMGNLQRMIYSNSKHFDLNDLDIQVLIAVHYLSLNDSQKRKEIWEGASPFDE